MRSQPCGDTGNSVECGRDSAYFQFSAGTIVLPMIMDGSRLKRKVKKICFITRMGDAKPKSLKQNLSLSW